MTTPILMQEREVARGPVRVVLAMCLGVESMAWRTRTDGQHGGSWTLKIDPTAGTVHWDSFAAAVPEMGSTDPEIDWLGI
jgi:hypothetical protein